MLTNVFDVPQIPGTLSQFLSQCFKTRLLLLHFGQRLPVCVRMPAHVCVRKRQQLGCRRETSGFLSFLFLFAYICLSLRTRRPPEEVWWRLRVMSGRHFQLPDGGGYNSCKRHSDIAHLFDLYLCQPIPLYFVLFLITIWAHLMTSPRALIALIGGTNMREGKDTSVFKARTQQLYWRL